ncbi:hypothetical protein PLESTB_000325100 [Pleodorina starrii]|uniref:ATP-dependent DNA helicase n=1 Tax=Pleodorina starrii TaxID=330485 RepID=A0A9W6BD79_9CHLO|nr:hypothetical protein PLESTB_000325100 [Pleodorina starrii]
MNMNNNKPSNKRGLLALAPTEHQATAKRPAVHEASRARALAALKSTYGYEAFRGKQEEAVLAAIAGRDVLVIMPTGGGKTICYVIPALVQPGVCIVVSPLLALMQDQVANLTKVGVRAAQLSSALPASQRAAIMADLTSGGGSGQPSIRLLLVTPELLAASGKFRWVLQRLHARRNLSLFAIDESHCISTWGHDFRPAYRRLAALRHDFPGVPIMALTATAASQVQDDICEQLRLQNPVRLLSSFNRPNISYTVRYLDVEGADEVGALISLLRAAAESYGAGGAVPCSIVYCQKRDTCETVAKKLSGEGLPARPYHGQMDEATKREVLRLWQADEVPVVVATIAFGMGIDKAGVRLVVHFNLPRSLEGFYQEAGRAGRDGRPAESVLFYSREARSRMDFVLKKDQEEKKEKEEQQKKEATKRGGGGGSGGGGAAGLGNDEGDDGEAEATALTATSEAEEAQVKTTAWEAFGLVVDWATTACCRRRALLGHFGERLPPGPCGGTGDGQAAGCDVCRDPGHVEEQLKKMRDKELDAAAKRQQGGWRCGGKGGDDEEADMFAVRGGGAGGGGGDGGGDGDDAGPSFYQAGRSGLREECAAHVAEARSAAASARAAAGGQVNDTYFAALAAMERQHEARNKEAAGDVVDRMLSGGAGGGGGSGGGSVPAPPLDAGIRANATSKLAAALKGSQAACGVDPELLQKLAAAVEADVHGNGLPRQLYTSRMAGLITRAKTAPSALALLPQSSSSGGGSGSGSAAPPAAFAELLPRLIQEEVAVVESLLLPQQGSEAAASAATARAVARLGALAAVAVTLEAVAAGGVGKRVNKLGRHGVEEVAEAARRAVASWKRQLPEKKPAAAPPQQQQD